MLAHILIGSCRFSLYPTACQIQCSPRGRSVPVPAALGDRKPAAFQLLAALSSHPDLQAAYGIIAEVESHPFDLDCMLFMDWRDDHTQADPEMREANK